MSDFQIARIKGGYRMHRKLPGEYVAICGAKPGVSKARHMRDRTGWAIYRDDYEFPHAFGAVHDMRCKVCFKPPE